MRRRAARWLVTASAWMVPRGWRARWREEWLGEIESRTGPGPAGAGLVRRALGAPRDAAAARAASVSQGLRALAAGWRSDLVHSARSVWHSPRHLLAVTGSLGIGLTVSIFVFSAINGLLYGEIPGIESRRTLARVFISHDNVFGVEGFGRAGMVSASPLSISDFELLAADDGPAFTGVAAEGSSQVPVALDAAAAGTTALLVSADYFPVLGTQPFMGRFLAASDHRPDAPPVAVVGFHLWRDRLGAPPNILGRSLLVGGRDFTIVGVAPPRFTGVQPSDVGASPLDSGQLWLPLRFAASWPGGPSRDQAWLTVVGRLEPGVSIADAGRTLDVAAARIAAERPDIRKNAQLLLRPHGFGPDDSPLEVLLIIGLFLAVPLSVLAIACANVASLQLARATGRERELAVRLALGASRGQLLRLLTLESLLLSALATLAGWLGSAAARRDRPRLLSPDARPRRTRPDLRARPRGGVVTLSGLVPAWLVLRRSTAAGLKQTAQGGGVAHARVRHALVVIQIAVSLVLLCTSALFARSVQAMRSGVPAPLRDQLVAHVDLEAVGHAPAPARAVRRCRAGQTAGAAGRPGRRGGVRTESAIRPRGPAGPRMAVRARLARQCVVVRRQRHPAALWPPLRGRWRRGGRHLRAAGARSRRRRLGHRAPARALQLDGDRRRRLQDGS